MKARIYSDLHVDLNERYKIDIPQDGMFTIFAGDTSGDPRKTIKFIKKNCKSGIVISGNHLPYNDQKTKDGEKLAIEELRHQLLDAFPNDGDITYLDVLTGTYHRIVDGVLFLASTMYVDYRLRTKYNPTGDLQKNLSSARPRISGGGMNDFVYGHTFEGSPDGGLTYLKPENYVKWHDITMMAFETVLDNNEAQKDPLPVVMVTHHAPLAMCLHSDGYHGENLINSSYASEKDDFIERHSSIKAWIYGHTHEHDVIHFTRKDGSKVLLVNNSRGYCGQLQDIGFSADCVLDTSDWSISKTSVVTYDERMKNISKGDLFSLLGGF